MSAYQYGSVKGRSCLTNFLITLILPSAGCIMVSWNILSWWGLHIPSFRLCSAPCFFTDEYILSFPGNHLNDRQISTVWFYIKIGSSKLLLIECVLRDKITSHLKPQQVSDRSCLTNLLNAVNILTKVVDEGSDVNLCFLYFSKAFSGVNHRILADKFAALVVSDHLITWIEKHFRCALAALYPVMLWLPAESRKA